MACIVLIKHKCSSAAESYYSREKERERERERERVLSRCYCDSLGKDWFAVYLDRVECLL